MVLGCSVTRRYVDVCYCDMFSVCDVYIDLLKFNVMCINGRWYISVAVNVILSLISAGVCVLGGVMGACVGVISQ